MFLSDNMDPQGYGAECVGFFVACELFLRVREGMGLGAQESGLGDEKSQEGPYTLLLWN